VKGILRCGPAPVRGGEPAPRPFERGLSPVSTLAAAFSRARSSASCRIASRRAFARYVTHTTLPARCCRTTRRRAASGAG
jgi:hypothetical protein